MNAPAPHPLLRRTASARHDPALQAAAEIFASQLRTGLRKVSLVAEISGEQIEATGSIASELAARKGRAIAAVFNLPAATGRIALMLDHRLVFAATEAILGGDGHEPPFLTDRALTRIEMRIARILAEQAGHSLPLCLKERGDHARFEKLETNLDFVDIGSSSKSSTVLVLQVTIFGQIGTLALIAPAEIAPLFAQPEHEQEPAAPTAEDPAWSQRLSAEIAQTDIRIDARFEDHGLTLGDIAALHVGQQIDLGGSGAELILESNAHLLFRGRLGQADGRYAVRIEDMSDSLSRSRSIP